VVLWVLEVSGRALIRLRDGPRHKVRASYRIRAYTAYGPVVHHTFLVEADARDGRVLEALIPTGSGIWELNAKPAPDGTYPDMESRSAVVVQDGAIVADEGG
jgi:hypothetical protein